MSNIIFYCKYLSKAKKAEVDNEFIYVHNDKVHVQNLMLPVMPGIPIIDPCNIIADNNNNVVLSHIVKFPVM